MADRRSRRGDVTRLVAAIAFYAIVLTASLTLLDSSVEQPWRTLVALIPVVPMGYVVWLVVDRIRSLDEYWQQIHLTALPIAFLGSMLVSFTWGFVENAGFEPLNGFVMFAIMGGLYLIGLWIAQRRHS